MQDTKGRPAFKRVRPFVSLPFVSFVFLCVLDYVIISRMIRIELSLRLPNSPGSLAGVCRLLSDERVNILAMALETGGQLRLVVDNHVHGAAVLREHHHQVTERDVIVTAVPNSPGALAPTLKLVSDANINVEYAYGGGSEGGLTATIVLGVEDAQRAAAAAGV
jgi:hypothetical protein